MKRILFHIMALIAGAAFAASCVESEIPVYQLEDSAVYFKSKANDFSLKGVTDAEPELHIPICLFGPACDYDREMLVEVADSSYNDAVLGTDFQIVSAKIPANELSGEIVLKVKQLDSEVPSHTVALTLVPNDSFQRTVKNLTTSKIHWSKEFVRPTNQYAWAAWFYFFSHSYSAAYHELLYNYFGPDIEITGYTNAARKDPDSKMRVISWWYTASRDFYDMVKEHDIANPDSPYMHSSDYEQYESYTQATGEGKKPETIPTVLSTLLVN